MLTLFLDESLDYNDVNYATTMSQLGRIRSFPLDDPDFLVFFDDLANQIISNEDWIRNSRAISNVVHAIGKLQLLHQPATVKSSEKIMNFCSDYAETIVSSGTPQGIANICWSIAKQNYTASINFVQEAERQASWILTGGAGSPQAVANLVWACATLGFEEAPHLLEQIEDQAEWVVRIGSPQAVGNTAWACATMGLSCPKLLSSMEQYSDRLVQEGTPQDLANMVWAGATLGQSTPNLLDELEQRSSWLVEMGSPQAIANVLWAFAKRKYPAVRIVAAMEQQASKLFKSPQAVANTAWACCKMGLECPRLFQAIEEHPHVVANMKPQEIANTAWACAKMSLHAPRLFRAIDEQSFRLIQEGSCQDACNTALAFATLGYTPNLFFDEFETIADTIVQEGFVQHVINACYALVMLDLEQRYQHEFRKLWVRAIQLVANDKSIITVEVEMQLYQIYWFAQASGLELPEPPIPYFAHNDNAGAEITWKSVPADYEQSRFWSQADGSVSSSSSLLSGKQEASSILRELGWKHDLRVSPIRLDRDGTTHEDDPGILAIDMANIETKVAIEYDGVWHFLREVGSGQVLPNMENGTTKAKRRFLECLGWNVTNIPYFGLETLRKRLRDSKKRSLS